MKIIESRLCENNQLKITYLFDKEITDNEVEILAAGNILFQTKDFPIPYFKIVDANNKYIMRGATGTNKLTIDFMDEADELQQEINELLMSVIYA